MYLPPINKIFVDSNITYLVFVYSDLERKYNNIVEVPKNELTIHEFGCQKELNEYVNVLIDINKTKIEALFHYLIVPQPTEFSQKFTNKSNQFV